MFPAQLGQGEIVEQIAQWPTNDRGEWGMGNGEWGGESERGREGEKV